MSEDNPIDPPEPPPPPLTAGQKKFLAVLGAALLVLVAGGAWYLYDIGAFRGRPTFNQTWAYCDAGDSCTAVRAPCDSWIAVSDKNLGDARAYYDHMIALVEDSPQMECATAPLGNKQPRAFCSSGLCILDQ